MKLSTTNTTLRPLQLGEALERAVFGCGENQNNVAVTQAAAAFSETITHVKIQTPATEKAPGHTTPQCQFPNFIKTDEPVQALRRILWQAKGGFEQHG